MSKRQYLFFDLGWTLEDESAAQVDRADKAARAAREFGIETTGEQILRLQDEGAGKMVPSVFIYALKSLGLDDSGVKEVIETATWDKSLLCLYPDAVDALEELGKNHYLGIIANQSPGTEARLIAYGIRDSFGLVIASAEFGLAKPDPAIFRVAQEKAGCGSEDAWMIGDRLDNDIRPAKDAGWRTIRVLNGSHAGQQPGDESEEPDYTVTALREIPEIIRRAPTSSPPGGQPSHRPN